MDPNELDWIKQLSERPLRRKGFTHELRERIEQKLDEKPSARKRWLPVRTMIGAAAAAAVLGMIAVLPSFTANRGGELKEAASSGQQSAASLSAPGESMESAVLIGLRTDQKLKRDTKGGLSEADVSSYRTLLLASVDGAYKLAGEGDGILMPYKQTFWKIDAPVMQTNTDVYQPLFAHLANKKGKPQVLKDDPKQSFQRIEKLMFAGNDYVAMSETEDVAKGSKPERYERVYVRTLMQLAEPHTMNFAENKIDKNHVLVQDAFEQQLNELHLTPQETSPDVSLQPALTGDQWTIERSFGQWKAKVAETYGSTSRGNLFESYMLHTITEPLPPDITSHDALCCTQQAVQSVVSGATDALSSPSGDVTIVVAGNRLEIYPYHVREGDKPMLTVNLKPGEKLVMAQWAIGKYIPSWIDQAERYLGKPAP